MTLWFYGWAKFILKKSEKLSFTEDCERSAIEAWDFIWIWIEIFAMTLVEELLTDTFLDGFNLLQESCNLQIQNVKQMLLIHSVKTFLNVKFLHKRVIKSRH